MASGPAGVARRSGEVTTETIVETRGARLLVRSRPGSGEPVLLLHGGPGCPDYLQPVADLLDGHPTVSFDQRGVGRSVALDGSFELHDYIADIEAIRESLKISTWHVFGHSWGGLLAQVYAARYPDRVRSLFLCSASLGLGADWRRTKREAFKTSRQRLGTLGFARLFGYGGCMYLGFGVARWAARGVMSLTWRSYFLDPASAPAPEWSWLSGCSREAIVKTDRAVTKADASELVSLDDFSGPVTTVFGAYDIYGNGYRIVEERFPQAKHILLGSSGHLPWVQNPDGLRSSFTEFYDSQTRSP